MALVLPAWICSGGCSIFPVVYRANFFFLGFSYRLIKKFFAAIQVFSYVRWHGGLLCMEYSISPLEIPCNICGLHRAVHITGKPYTSPKGKVPGPAVVHVYYRPHPYQLEKSCYSLLLSILPYCPQCIVLQRIEGNLYASCCFLPQLKKVYFLMPVSVFSGTQTS